MRDVLIGLFALWLTGFLFVMVRVARALVGLNFLRRASRPHTLDYADLPFTGATGRECELRISDVKTARWRGAFKSRDPASQKCANLA